MFNAIARPFGMLLMILYDVVNNYGVAILLFAVVVRIILLPFQMKSKYGMMQQTRLQPKIAELQKKHGTNKTKINEETQKLYREEGINPMSGCIWGFLPMPIMIALFMVIRQPLTMMLGVAAELLEEGGALLNRLTELGFQSTMGEYYLQVDQAKFISENIGSFASLNIENLKAIDFNFLGLHLSTQPQWNFLWTTEWGDPSVWLPGLMLFIIPLLSGGSQMIASYINKKISPTAPPGGQGSQMQTFMMLMPLISVYFAFVTPAALGFYWTAGTVLQIGQDIWLTKKYTKRIDAEEAVRKVEREKKEAELEAKRLETERKKAAGIVEKNPNKSKRKKQSNERQEQLEKAAEWEKKKAPSTEEKFEPSRVGNRRYARGRAYDPDRYKTGRRIRAYEDSDSDEYEPEEDTGDEGSVEPDHDEVMQETSDAVSEEREDVSEDGYEDDEDEDDTEDEDEDDTEDEGEDANDTEDEELENTGENTSSQEVGPPDHTGYDHDTNPTVRFGTTRFESEQDSGEDTEA